MPFKHGDIREDGYVFRQYQGVINKNGFEREHWYNPKSFLERREKENSYSHTQYHKNKCNPKTKASRLIQSAKQRGKVTITADWVCQKIKNGVCELTGLPFDLGYSEHNQNPLSPSLDRIDANKKEYSAENTRVVLTAVNISLNQYGEKTMLPILKAMVLAIEKNILLDALKMP